MVWYKKNFPLKTVPWDWEELLLCRKFFCQMQSWYRGHIVCNVNKVCVLFPANIQIGESKNIIYKTKWGVKSTWTAVFINDIQF